MSRSISLQRGESSTEPVLLRSRTQLKSVIHVCNVSRGYFIKELVEAEFPDVKLQPSFTKSGVI